VKIEDAKSRHVVIQVDTRAICGIVE